MKEARTEWLSDLTERQSEVYQMYYESQMTQSEIADRLGISQKAVDYRLEGIEKKMRNADNSVLTTLTK